jgi:TetR/AcrR family transcriptional regulator, repressor for uid operon
LHRTLLSGISSTNKTNIRFVRTQTAPAMPKLKPETQALRRDHILEVAEGLFARKGFHRTTMHDICREAGVSPGALYVHFDSKEALIEGLCERDRAAFGEQLAGLAGAPDFLDAVKVLGAHYFVDEPAEKRLFVAEMAVESTRNPRIASIYRAADAHCLEGFERLFCELAATGKIEPGIDPVTLARIFHLIGEGVMWRRAVHPDFDFADVRDGLMTLIERLVRPRPQRLPSTKSSKNKPVQKNASEKSS